jgi:hypothetical protein
LFNRVASSINSGVGKKAISISDEISFNELLEMDRVASGSVFAILVRVSCPLLVSIHLFRVIFDLDEDISLGFFGLSVLDFKE